MQIILLSGGSGIRLWPLSNDARSKQFLKLLPSPEEGRKESMIQRVVRQLREADISAALTVATGRSQRESVETQLGGDVNVVVEPSRRDTFPAICLACEYLSRVKGCSDDEPVIVMPCDPYTNEGYFQAIAKMGEGVEADTEALVVMGIKPTYPSAKYGYILPEGSTGADGIIKVKEFKEKPSVEEARKLIERGALWNSGVFGFRLGYMLGKARRYVGAGTYAEVLEKFASYPKISFDYEVAEKASSAGMVVYDGYWKDLGTWNTLTDELHHMEYGNVLLDDNASNTHVFNETGLPILCIGTNNLVIAASPDGILVSEKKRSEDIKMYVERLKTRPMFEERRWGTYVVTDSVEFDDGFDALTKRLTLLPGCSISYQQHDFRDETWIFIDGEGEIIIDGKKDRVKRGDTVTIRKGQKHALKAITRLTFIEVQTGSTLVEEDIRRFPFPE